MLSWILYNRELRDTIKELKAKGDFRRQGLYPHYRQKVFTLTLTVFIVWLIERIQNGPEIFTNFWEKSHSHGLVAIGVMFILSLVNRGDDYLMNVTRLIDGQVTYGKIIKFFSGPPYNYKLDYSWSDPEGCERKKHFGPLSYPELVSDDYVAALKHSTPEKLYVVYDPENFNISLPFIPKSYLRRIISQKAHRKFTQLSKTKEMS